MDQSPVVDPLEDELAGLSAALASARVPIDKAYLALDAESRRRIVIVALSRTSSKRDVYRRLLDGLEEAASSIRVDDIYLVSEDEPGLAELELLARPDERWSHMADENVVDVAGRTVVGPRRLRVSARDLEDAVVRFLMASNPAGHLRVHDRELLGGQEVDIVIESPRGPVLIECKALTKPVPTSALLQVIGMLTVARSRWRPDAKAILVTTSELSDAAAQLLLDVEGIHWLNWTNVDARPGLLSVVGAVG